MSSLSDRLGSFPEPWRPSPGDKVIGEVTEIDERDSDYGDPYTIITLLTDEGEEVSVHCFHTMLRNAVERKRPQVGDRVGVAYFGQAESAPAGMNPAERYRLIVERAANGTTDAGTAEAAAADAQPELNRPVRSAVLKPPSPAGVVSTRRARNAGG
jgi:hypothetical protein